MTRTWVFLRGLARHKEHWGLFSTRIQESFPGDRFFFEDLSGNGEWHSKDSFTNHRLNVEFLRQNLREKEALTAGPVWLVGLSQGGMVSALWASLYPDEIQHLWLVNSSSRNFSQLHQRFSFQQIPLLVENLFLKKTNFEIEIGLLEATTNLLSREQKIDWAKKFSSFPMTTRKNILRQLFASLQFSFPENLKTTKTTLVYSKADRLVAPECSLDIAKNFGFETWSHPTAGHDLFLDDPDWFISNLKQNLS
jgi:pimeloyl-ACP methyl ester carboxylesterase